MIYSISRYTEVPYFFMDQLNQMIEDEKAIIKMPISKSDELEDKEPEEKIISLKPEDVSGIYLWSKSWYNYIPYREAYEQKYRIIYNHSAPLLPTPIGGTDFFDSVDDELMHLAEVADMFGDQLIWHLSPLIVSSITPVDYWLDMFNKAIQLLKRGPNFATIKEIVISLYDPTPYSERRLVTLFSGRSGIINYPLSPKDATQLMIKLSKMASEVKIKVTTCRNPFLVADANMAMGSCIALDPLKRCIGSNNWKAINNYPPDPEPSLNADGTPASYCQCVKHLDLGFLFEACPAICPYCSEGLQIDHEFNRQVMEVSQ